MADESSGQECAGRVNLALLTCDGAIPQSGEDRREAARRYGRMGGAPIQHGSIESADGATLASVHVTRLRKLAESLDGRQQQHVLAAIACIQTLSRKNKRLGAKVGATARRKLLTHRGVELSGKPEDIAADIVDLASSLPSVAVYRLPRRRVRVTTNADLPNTLNRYRIGTYDAACDYRRVLEDVQEALAA